MRRGRVGERSLPLLHFRPCFIAQLRYISWKLIPHNTIIPPSIRVSSSWRRVCGIDPTT